MSRRGQNSQRGQGQFQHQTHSPSPHQEPNPIQNQNQNQFHSHSQNQTLSQSQTISQSQATGQSQVQEYGQSQPHSLVQSHLQNQSHTQNHSPVQHQNQVYNYNESSDSDDSMTTSYTVTCRPPQAGRRGLAQELTDQVVADVTHNDLAACLHHGISPNQVGYTTGCPTVLRLSAQCVGAPALEAECALPYRLRLPTVTSPSGVALADAVKTRNKTTKDLGKVKTAELKGLF